MVTPVLTAAAVTPLLLERAWASVSVARAPRPATSTGAIISWGVIAFAAIAYPASMLTGYSGLRLPGGAPPFPTRDECVRPASGSEQVRIVLGYADSYAAAGALRDRARGAGLQSTVARDGCGRLRVYVDDVLAGEAGGIVASARAQDLQPALERDPDE